MVAFTAIALFFFKYWRKTRDELFGVFAAAFLVLAAERIFLLINATVTYADAAGHELRPLAYWIRFLAFALILIGFYLKNRRTQD